jgi:hypothetical protein
MERLLLIDDIREVEPDPAWDTVIARTPSEGLEQIAKGWDLVALDHDLANPATYVPSLLPGGECLQRDTHPNRSRHRGVIEPAGGRVDCCRLRHVYPVEVKPAGRVISLRQQNRCWRRCGPNPAGARLAQLVA